MDHKKVINEEAKKLNLQNGAGLGIALSGGGVRSATVNLGVLRVFNKLGVIENCCYMSSVSGGGYINSHIQAKIYCGQKDSLFCKEDVEFLKNNSNILAPNQKNRVLKFAELFLSSFALQSMLFFSIIAPLITLAFSIVVIIVKLIPFEIGFKVLFSFLLGTLSFFLCLYVLFLLIKMFITGGAQTLVKTWNYETNVREEHLDEKREGIEKMSFKLSFKIASYAFNLYEMALSKKAQRIFRIVRFILVIGSFLAGALILFQGVYLIGYFFFVKYLLSYITIYQLFFYSVIASIFSCILAFYYNPNTLGLHGVYRNILRNIYLNINGKFVNPHLIQLKENRPYPLFNSCVNNSFESRIERLKGKADEADYFLLSPHYSGSKQVKYKSTEDWDFNGEFDLATTMSISGAALNPQMGLFKSRMFKIFSLLLNIRLGFWANNPSKKGKWFPWWPKYLWRELLGNSFIEDEKVNLSDGGHIENLGVYELLRRRCKLIIAIDASADPDYEFNDLSNLVKRSRDELGIHIDFGANPPEKIIRPQPSQGYSNSHYAIATLRDMKKKPYSHYADEGILVYLKSSLKEQKAWKDIPDEKIDDHKGFFYKTYHPKFPHEPTSDQMFDKIQWQAYFDLGERMAADLFGEDVSNITENKFTTADEIIEHFIKMKR